MTRDEGGCMVKLYSQDLKNSHHPVDDPLIYGFTYLPPHQEEP